MIKKLLALTIAVGAFLTYAVCTHCGTYHNNGTIVTYDGNEWGYDDETIDDNARVWVHFNHNGTLNKTDDIIMEVRK